MSDAEYKLIEKVVRARYEGFPEAVVAEKIAEQFASSLQPKRSGRLTSYTARRRV